MIFSNLPDKNRVWEALPKVNGKTIPEPDAKVVTTMEGKMFGDTPDVSFSQLIMYKDCTPQIKIAIDTYRNLIVGTQINVNSDDESCKEIIEEWNRKTGFFDKWNGFVETVLTCGVGILEKLDEITTLDVLEVDMKTIVGKKRDIYGFTEYYIQRGVDGKTHNLTNLEKYIEFELTNSSRSIWAKSLFYSLAVSRTVGDRTTKPLVEQLWALEDAITAIPINHAYPKEYHIFEGADQTRLDKEAIKIKRWKPGDKYIGTKMPEVQLIETKGDSKYTDYINYFSKTIELGTQFPHDIMTGDFTSRASSETTDNMVMKRVQGFQRYLANKLKSELYDPILKQMGKNPETANLQISFGNPDVIELTVDQVLALFNSKAISIDEFREYLKNKKAMDLFDDIEIQPEEDPQDVNLNFAKKKQMERRAKQIKKKFEESEVTEAELRKDRKKLIKGIAEKNGIKLD